MSAYTHGLYAKWTYLFQLDLTCLLSTLEKAIHQGQITGHGIPNANEKVLTDNIYKTSILVSAPFIDLIVGQSKSTFRKGWSQQQQIKLEVRKDILKAKSDAAADLYIQLPTALQHLINFASEKGASI